VATPESPQRHPQKLSTAPSSTANGSNSVRFYDFNGFRIDIQRRRLLRNGEPIPIKPKALDTLLALVENRGRVVEKDDLMRRLWPDTAVEEANLTQNVFVVRKALGEAPGEQKFIATLARRGYQFVGEVREVVAEEDQTALESDPASRLNPYLRRNRVALGILTIAVVAVAVAFAAAWSWRSAGTSSHISAIAVLPFRNVSADPEQEYFADGITDAVIADLASISALRVVSRQSVMRYKSSHKSMRDIARELGVDALIEGSVSRVAGRVRLTVQLVDGRTDDHLWAHSYDRDLGNMLSLQGELARAVAQAVRVTVTELERGGLAKRRPVEPEAYDLYLRGLYFWGRRGEEGLLKSLDYYQRAIARDPTFALAYAGIALTYNPLAVQGFMPAADARLRLRAAAQRALALDPALMEAQMALATVTAHGWDWQEGERAWMRILDRSPNNATARLWYGWLLDSLGRFSEALTERERAVAADPLSLQNNISLGGSLCQVGRCRDAIARFQLTLELDPQFPAAHAGLGATYLKMGRGQEGIAALEEAVRLSNGNIRMIAALGHAFGVAGRNAEARAILQTLEERSRQRYIAPFFLAWVHAGLGQRDAAFARLEEAYREGSPGLLHIKADPPLESLRTDPRFQHLLLRMNLPVQ
jgi:TolB-like protein/DNA-binding winged helix-turn-helix (wHTH) protein/tetratricopeptide (TPR) repeat protein